MVSHAAARQRNASTDRPLAFPAQSAGREYSFQAVSFHRFWTFVFGARTIAVIALTFFGYYKAAAWTFTGVMLADGLLWLLIALEFVKTTKDDSVDTMLEKQRVMMKRLLEGDKPKE
jgi:hypothetical protein